MKLYYQTAEERIEIEVEEEWGEFVMNLNRKEASRNRSAREHEVHEAPEMPFSEFLPYVDSDLESLLNDEPDEEELLERRKVKVHQAFERMIPEEAALLQAIYFRGVTQKELAEKYGIGKSAMSQRVSRAKRHFKKIYLDLP